MKKTIKYLLLSFLMISSFCLIACDVDISSGNDNNTTDDSGNNSDDSTNNEGNNNQGSTTVVSEYTISYYNGTELFATEKVKNNTLISGVTPPTKDGYTFEYWCIDSGLSTKFNLSTKITKDMKLYAKFSVNQYTVKFMDGATELSSSEVNFNSVVNKPSDPTKSGYVFVNWYSDSSFTTLFDFTTKITDNTKVYAKFNEIITYTVQFLDSSNASVSTTQTVTENTCATKPSDPTKTGYVFENWYTDSSFTTVFDFNTKINSNTKVYAKFEAVPTYTVEFLDSTNASVATNQTINENTCATKPTNPTKTGYKFINWYTDTNFTTIFDFTTKINSNTKIYAKFEELAKYDVDFLDENGSTVAQSQTVTEGECATKPSDPTKEGYTFKGWYTDDDFTTAFDFTTKITTDTVIYAKFVDPTSIQIEVSKSGGNNEGAYVEFEMLENTSLSDYTVKYQLSGGSLTTLDSSLIRTNGATIRADILGLKAGTYSITITEKNSEAAITLNNIAVTAADRSGYAHFGATEGVGAYNNDGTVKSNTVIVYVNDSNKNTVTATIAGSTCTGLANILKKQSSSSNPLLIRVIGRIGAATWNPITYSGSSLSNTSIIGLNGQAITKGMDESAIISGGYNTLNTTTATKLNGLTNKVSCSSGECDSYFNMMDVSSASNVTVEGVGTDAEIFQWGFTWSKCKSIEVKNLTFTDYPEDACSFQGGSNSDVNTYGRYWVHNNVFNKGKNNWDVTYEQDKPAGDGATDFKYCYGITSCYNKFNSCKKTGLVGGSNGNYTKSVTFHHNYYNQVGSRLPLGRQANMHIYNNYYYKCGTAQDIRANAFVLSEANYFEECSYPQKVTKDDTYTGTVIKSYNDYFTGGGSSQATIVTSRTQTLTGNCKPDGSSNYTNFDTNSSLFYYDSTKQKSNVTLLTDAATAKNDCIKLAGVLAGDFVANNNSGSGSTDSGNTGGSEDSGNTGTESGGNSGSTTIENSTVLTFNNFSTGNISSATTVDGLTVNPKSGKTCKIDSNTTTIANTAITKTVYLGGGGSFTELSVTFTTTKTANITVYYKSSGTSERNAMLFSSTGSTKSSNTVTDTVGSSTFNNVAAGTYSIASASSAIYVYAIVIEYTE